jgi:F420-0:gamma-glutamyl ligase
MNIQVIKIKRIEAYESLFDNLIASLPTCINEKTVIVISSKIISLCEGSVAVLRETDKDELIKQQSEMYLERSFVPGGYVMHTFKNNMLMPSAGIDASNTGNYYSLLPKNSYTSAKEIHAWISQNYNVKELGIIISDSRSTPLRNGVIGYSLGSFGFNPLHNYRGTQDLYGRKMNVSQINFSDSLAAAAVLAMGEGSESTPLAIIENISRIEFGLDYNPLNIEIDPKDDIYMPFFSLALWKKGGK